MDQTDFLFKLVGAVVGLGALITGAVMRDRAITKKILDGDGKNHARIDELKDTMNSEFARKDDVKESVARVERSIETLGQQMREQHDKLTTILLNNQK